MKPHPSIATSLSRIIVSLLLTCPTLVDYSYDSANSGFALAAPPTGTEERHHAMPKLRVGLPATGRQAKRAVIGRHGDHEDEADGYQGHDVMDMFDAALMDHNEPPSHSSAIPSTPSTSSATDDEEHDGHTVSLLPDEAYSTPKQTTPILVSEEKPKGHAHGDHLHDSQQSGHIHHSSSWVPLTDFNETDVILRHGVAPLSYLYYDFVLTPSETFNFRRTGLSAYGNATTDLTNLQQGEYDAWREDQYALGVGSREEDRVLGGDGHPHPGLMALHVVSFSLAYFGILPIVLALRAAKLESLAYGISKLAFGMLVFLGWISGVWYKNATPELYAGHKHNIGGNLLLLATAAIGAIDLVAMGRRLYQFATSTDKSFRNFVNTVVYCKGQKSQIMEEYERVTLANQLELDDLDDHGLSGLDRRMPLEHHARARSDPVIFTAPRANRADEEHRYSQSSNTSDTSTLRDSPVFSGSPHEMGKHHNLPTRGMSDESSGSVYHKQRAISDPQEHVDAHPRADVRTTREQAARVGVYLLHFYTRGLVVWAYIVSIMGIVVYTGMGRYGYLPSLLAHLIKGSIFFW
jgi:hypothetical protein